MPLRNSQLDRIVDFVPNRILKATELEMVQDLVRTRDEAGLGVVYREGALLNVTPLVNANTLSLGPTEPGLPMYVFVRGQFEVLAPVSLTYNVNKTSGTDFVYLNYVIWRVTYNEAGTITDSSLIDSGTGEKVAELGQIELSASESDLSIIGGQVLDTSKEIERNQTAIILYTLARGSGGSITVQPNDRASAVALADDQEAGLVKLSYPGSTVAVADNDPVLTEPREPSPRSIREGHMSLATLQVPPAISNVWGLPKADLSGNHGISTWDIYDPSTQTILSDLLGSMVTMVSLCFGRLGNLTQNTVAPSVPTSYTPPSSPTVPSEHIDKPLGQPGSHPAQVVSDESGFIVNRASSVAGTDGQKAFNVKTAGQDLAYITHSGDMYAHKAAQSSVGGQPLGMLSAIATKVADHINNHPTGGAGAAQSYVDSQDLATLAAAKTYTDQSAASGSLNATYQLSDTNVNWIVLTLGNLEFAIGRGAVQDGTQISLPFQGGNFLGTVSPASLFNLANMTELNCTLENLTVRCYARTTSGTLTTGSWANFFGICFRII